MMARDFALVVLGATGYTGKLVCEYLAKQQGVGSWAIAGRSEEKLNDLKKELGVDVAIRVVDFADIASLKELCSKTKVLISCAGPFTEIGIPVVEACVQCGTHYVDSTGEFNFVRLVIERFHEEAKRKGILIVPCCGFDSVPGDLGNYLVHQRPDVREVKAFYHLVGGKMSGGTARSMFAVRAALVEADKDPYSLVPKDTPRPSVVPRVQKGIWYDTSVNKIIFPFLMSAINERVVRRTNALMEYEGIYTEVLESSLWNAIYSTAMSYITAIVLWVPFLRDYAKRVSLPPAGSGPTEAQKESSHYKCLFVGLDEAGVIRRKVHLSHTQDMYTASAMYIAEAALSLLQLEKSGTLKSGVLTPMSAFGEVLRNRVEKAGVVLSVSDE